MKSQDLQVMLQAFPKQYAEDVKQIFTLLACKHSLTPGEDTTHIKLEHEAIRMPGRIYYKEINDSAMNHLSEMQKRLIYCYFLCHHNGFLRQKYLRRLLESKHLYEHELPYVIYLTGSYLVEIIDDIYDAFELVIHCGLDQLIVNNLRFFMTIEGRIASYWGEYYQHIPKKKYSGFKLQGYYLKTKKQFIRSTKNSKHTKVGK